LQSVSVSVHPGQKIALIGANGTGKSSLLAEIADPNSKESGISRNGKIVLVPQIREQADDACLNYQFAASLMDEWWRSFEIARQAFGLELNESGLLNALSGGEWLQFRIAIALALNPSLLLLDEPTNHLDATARKLLLKLLQNLLTPYIVVSHDEDFLEAVSNTIWELKSQKIQTSTGSYSEYRQAQLNEQSALQRIHEKHRKQLVKAKQAAKRQQERYQKATSQLKRKSKAQDRSTSRGSMDAMQKKLEQNKGKAQLQHTKRIAEIAKEIDETKSKSAPNLAMNLAATASKGMLVRVEDGTLSFNNRRLLHIPRFSVEPGDRILLRGDNGTGKSTLLTQLAEKQNARLTGVSYGSELEVAYIDQHYSSLNPSDTVYDTVANQDDSLTQTAVRSILASSGFATVADIQKQVMGLSGGEKARLVFVQLAVKKPDLLLLDEPSNNLDIQTKLSIAGAIAAFEGALVIVSHDPAFISRAGVDWVYEITNGRLGPRQMLDHVHSGDAV